MHRALYVCVCCRTRFPSVRSSSGTSRRATTCTWASRARRRAWARRRTSPVSTRAPLWCSRPSGIGSRLSRSPLTATAGLPLPTFRHLTSYSLRLLSTVALRCVSQFCTLYNTLYCLESTQSAPTFISHTSRDRRKVTPLMTKSEHATLVIWFCCKI